MLTWKEVEGEKTAKARLVAKGYQGPDLRMGNVDIARCASRRSFHLQAISPVALKKWPLWGLDIENVFPQADGFGREVVLRVPCEWNPKDTRRVWKSRAPAYGLNDAPASFHRSLHRHPANSAESLSSVGLRPEVSSFGPRVYFVYRESGRAVGVIATHIYDILGRGKPDLLPKVRRLLERDLGN